MKAGLKRKRPLLTRCYLSHRQKIQRFFLRKQSDRASSCTDVHPARGRKPRRHGAWRTDL